MLPVTGEVEFLIKTDDLLDLLKYRNTSIYKVMLDLGPEIVLYDVVNKKTIVKSDIYIKGHFELMPVMEQTKENKNG